MPFNPIQVHYTSGEGEIGENGVMVARIDRIGVFADNGGRAGARPYEGDQVGLCSVIEKSQPLP